jgi:hypothetical protein
MEAHEPFCFGNENYAVIPFKYGTLLYYCDIRNTLFRANRLISYPKRWLKLSSAQVRLLIYL